MDSFESNLFGELLKSFRQRRKLTQSALAHRIEKHSRGSIQGWEGSLYLPSDRETVLALAHALQLTEGETDQLLLAAHYPQEYHTQGSITQQQGEHEQARDFYQQNLERAEQLGNLDEQAIILSQLGEIAQKQGKYEEAEPLLRQALAIQRSVLGDAHPDLTDTLSNLARLYRSTGNYTQAESLYQQALAIQRTVFGEVHPDVATTLNHLAGLYHTM
jgi:tetratricopeptide (TPR) repeat protein